MKTNKLNQIASLLTSNGIEATKEMVIGIAIKTLVDAGYEVKAAYDEILGEGEYNKMTALIFNELKAAWPPANNASQQGWKALLNFETPVKY